MTSRVVWLCAAALVGACASAPAKGRSEWGTLVVACERGGYLVPDARIFVNGFEVGDGPCATVALAVGSSSTVRAGVDLGGGRVLAFEARDVRVEKDRVLRLRAALEPEADVDVPALAFALSVRRVDESSGAFDAMSPDGRTLARAAETNSVEISDTVGGASRRLGEKGEYWVSFVRALAFSADGRWLASTGVIPDLFERVVAVWDPATGARRAAFYVRSENVHAVALDAHGRLVAAGFDGGTVRLWDVAAGRLRWRSAPLSADPISKVVFVDGGAAVATDAGEAATALLDARTGAVLETLPGRLLGVLSDGRVVTSVARASERTPGFDLGFWDPRTGRRLGGATVDRWPSLFCPTWPVCVVSGGGRTEVWNWEDGTILWAVAANASGITEDGRRLVTDAGVYALPPIPARASTLDTGVRAG